MNNTNKARLALVASLLAPAAAAAQSPSSPVVGTWQLVSNVQTTADGRKVDAFGSPPSGMAMYGPDGRFMIVNTRPDLPKFASGQRTNGTPDENKAIVSGSIALFGTYTVSEPDRVVVLKVTGSTWPAWIGTEQRRPYVLEGDTMTWNVGAASGGGTAQVTWKKMK